MRPTLLPLLSPRDCGEAVWVLMVSPSTAGVPELAPSPLRDPVVEMRKRLSGEKTRRGRLTLPRRRFSGGTVPTMQSKRPTQPRWTLRSPPRGDAETPDRELVGTEETKDPDRPRRQKTPKRKARHRGRAETGFSKGTARINNLGRHSDGSIRKQPPGESRGNRDVLVPCPGRPVSAPRSPECKPLPRVPGALDSIVEGSDGAPQMRPEGAGNRPRRPRRSSPPRTTTRPAPAERAGPTGPFEVPPPTSLWRRAVAGSRRGP